MIVDRVQSRGLREVKYDYRVLQLTAFQYVVLEVCYRSRINEMTLSDDLDLTRYKVRGKIGAASVKDI